MIDLVFPLAGLFTGLFILFTLFKPVLIADVIGFVALEADGIACMDAVMPDCKSSTGALNVSVTDFPVKSEIATPITTSMASASTSKGV